MPDVRFADNLSENHLHQTHGTQQRASAAAAAVS